MSFIFSDEDDISFEDILSFATGTDDVPCLGFPDDPKLFFLHDEPSMFPKANTCAFPSYYTHKLLRFQTFYEVCYTECQRFWICLIAFLTYFHYLLDLPKFHHFIKSFSIISSYLNSYHTEMTYYKSCLFLPRPSE